MSMTCFLGGLISINADKPSQEEDKRIDWLGSLLVTAGLVQIIYALSQGELAENKWKTSCRFLAVFSFKSKLQNSFEQILSSSSLPACYAASVSCAGNTI
jgi:hypothetical protein